jgi:hypothetical protein
LPQGRAIRRHAEQSARECFTARFERRDCVCDAGRGQSGVAGRCPASKQELG